MVAFVKRLRRVGVLSLLIGAVVMSFAACGAGSSSPRMMDGGGMGGSAMWSGNQPEGSIRVDLVNWAVRPEKSSAKAGRVTFWAVHDMSHRHGASEGGRTHDLQVMRKLSDGGLKRVGQVQGLTMGQAAELVLDLSPGEYELVCDVVEEVNGKAIGHYAKGMHTDFTVIE